ncbi:MAG: hypothetical protein OER82_12835, partial [Nitrosopumilus sp.]|nr:hypothetical protein [Nitrosopumilus sp.]
RVFLMRNQMLLYVKLHLQHPRVTIQVSISLIALERIAQKPGHPKFSTVIRAVRLVLNDLLEIFSK